VLSLGFFFLLQKKHLQSLFLFGQRFIFQQAYDFSYFFFLKKRKNRKRRAPVGT
jgi:hypothetical protein